MTDVALSREELEAVIAAVEVCAVVPLSDVPTEGRVVVLLSALEKLRRVLLAGGMPFDGHLTR